MNKFLTELKISFPNFETEWNIYELPYLFIGDFVCYIINNKEYVNLEKLDLILNYFLESELVEKNIENIVLVGFLEVLHDDSNLYNQLKLIATSKLKRII